VKGRGGKRKRLSGAKGGKGGGKGAKRFAIRRALGGGAIFIPAEPQGHALNQISKVRGKRVNRFPFGGAVSHKVSRKAVLGEIKNDSARSGAKPDARSKRGNGGERGGRGSGKRCHGSGAVGVKRWHRSRYSGR